MSIDDATTASTAELCLLLGCTKGHIAHLARDGVIAQTDRNEWPLAKTVRAIVEHMKAQRSAISESRARWEAARAKREEQRAEREANRAQRKRDEEFDLAWKTCWHILVSKLVAVPARCSRDAVVRATIERELDAARNEVCNEFERQSEALAQTGEAAPVR
jgi:hypothetical protein